MYKFKQVAAALACLFMLAGCSDHGHGHDHGGDHGSDHSHDAPNHHDTIN